MHLHMYLRGLNVKCRVTSCELVLDVCSFVVGCFDIECSDVDGTCVVDRSAEPLNANE